MASNFHESYVEDEKKPPSERSTGLVFAAVAIIVAVLRRDRPDVAWIALGLGVGLAAVSLLAPGLLRPLNSLWFKFGLLLHRIVNPIVMLVVLVVVFIPAGVLMRLWRDPLRSRRLASGATSYWIERKTSGHTERSMSAQF